MLLEEIGMIAGKKTAVLAVIAGLGLFVMIGFARAQSWSDLPDDTSVDAKTPPPDLAGHWEGSVKDSGFGQAEITLDLTQKKSKIGGTWDILDHFSGTIASGSVNGNKGTVSLKFRVNKMCAPKVSGVLSNGNMTITGHYFSNTKHCHASGTFTVNQD
jgi:hypothetical protein